MTSVGPPAPKGTIRVIGRVGYVCAQAKLGTAESAPATAARRRNCLRGRFMALLPGVQPGAGNAGSEAATANQIQDRRLECSPADGTSAAAKARGISACPAGSSDQATSALRMSEEGE